MPQIRSVPLRRLQTAFRMKIGFKCSCVSVIKTVLDEGPGHSGTVSSVTKKISASAAHPASQPLDSVGFPGFAPGFPYFLNKAPQC